MIKPGQQFRVDSVEELKEAYEHLDFYYSLQKEIDDFNKQGMRYVKQSKGDSYIMLHHFHNKYKTIPNPFKEHKPKLKGIDKALNDLSNEAKQLGFGVEVVFKNLDK